MSCWSRRSPQKTLGAIRGGERETCARWVRACADGRTALDHGTKKKRRKKRFEVLCMQLPVSTAAETSICTTQKHLPFQMKPICILLGFFPPSLFVWLSFFSSLLMGKWRVFGSYLDNSHIFLGPPCALGGEALVALTLSQSRTQLCASHSAQHYLVTAAASLGLSETKSSQSQLCLLLNSFLFSVMHLLEPFQDEEKPMR